jgi:hypothetical protein
MKYRLEDLTDKLTPIEDNYMASLKESWFTGSHELVTSEEFVPKADEWFKSTKLNTLDGWDKFTCVDMMQGCTHFIENFILKHGWDGCQILENEYSYYTMQGKHGTKLGELKPNIPLIVSMPNWAQCSLHPQWDDLLSECEEKNIDVHIDFAWITTAKNINLDVAHPCIKSFGMSMSKYSMQWNRIGLRYTRQRTMDSITMLNHYYSDVNSALTSAGSFMIDNLPRDYGWDTYGDEYHRMCKELGVYPTDFLQAVKVPGVEHPKGCAKILTRGK